MRDIKLPVVDAKSPSYNDDLESNSDTSLDFLETNTLIDKGT